VVGNKHGRVVRVGPVVLLVLLRAARHRDGTCKRIGLEQSAQRNVVLIAQISFRKDMVALVARVGDLQVHLCREFLIDREIVVIGHRLFVVMRVKSIDRKWAENRIPCCPRKAITTGNIGRARSVIRRRILNLIVGTAQVRRH
jgi:hypothetical protein